MFYFFGGMGDPEMCSTSLKGYFQLARAADSCWKEWTVKWEVLITFPVGPLLQRMEGSH